MVGKVRIAGLVKKKLCFTGVRGRNKFSVGLFNSYHLLFIASFKVVWAALTNTQSRMLNVHLYFNDISIFFLHLYLRSCCIANLPVPSVFCCPN